MAATNGSPNSSREYSEWEAAVSSLLDAARPFLRGELGSASADRDLPSLLSVLRAAGAGECYHKHGTFLAHLVDVHRILRLWGASDAVARCGLFHSAYSNSYVDLAIFHPDTGREQVRGIVGADAERLVHLFCVVPRHHLIFEQLISRYTDQELRDHLAAADAEIVMLRDANPPADAAKGSGLLLATWRRKVRSVVAPEGVVAAHIRTGEPVPLSRRVVAAFLLMTVADFSDQYTDYQDELFGNADGRLEFRGDRWDALWPGTGKPGLWVSAMSRLAALYGLIARDEHLITLQQQQQQQQQGADHQNQNADDDVAVGELVIPPVFERCSRVPADHQNQNADDDVAVGELVIPPVFERCSRVPADHQNQNADDDVAVGELVIPPVFERCSRVLDPGEQKAARDLYWEAITSKDKDNTEALLRESIAKNPFVGEPHLVLAQVLLNAGGRYAEAEAAAGRGVRLLLQWGSAWDKRMTWEGWVSWGRLMGDKARQATWPRTAWGIINLGLVQGVTNRN